jgi:hypothetical protein
MYALQFTATRLKHRVRCLVPAFAAIAKVPLRMSAFRGRADMAISEGHCLLLTQSGHQLSDHRFSTNYFALNTATPILEPGTPISHSLNPRLEWEIIHIGSVTL